MLSINFPEGFAFLYGLSLLETVSIPLTSPGIYIGFNSNILAICYVPSVFVDFCHVIERVFAHLFFPRMCICHHEVFVCCTWLHAKENPQSLTGVNDDANPLNIAMILPCLRLVFSPFEARSFPQGHFIRPVTNKISLQNEFR